MAVDQLPRYAEIIIKFICAPGKFKVLCPKLVASVCASLSDDFLRNWPLVPVSVLSHSPNDQLIEGPRASPDAKEGSANNFHLNSSP